MGRPKKGKEKFDDITYVPDEEESDSDEYMDFSFVDCAPEIFKPTSTLSDDPFLNSLTAENILRGTTDEMEEEDGPEIEHEVEHEHMDEDEVQVGVEYRVHDPNVNWKLMEPVVGELYESPAQLRFALTNYAVYRGYQLCFVKSDKSRLIVKCGRGNTERACPWRLYATWKYNERTFQIKSMIQTHLCARNYKFGKLITCEWLARHYIKEIIRKPKFTTTEMREDALRKFSIEVCKSQCYRAKVRAREMIEGKLHDHYARVWDYAHEMLRSNPGSTCKVGVTVNPDGKNYFQRFYICFKAFRDGWKRGCRRIVGLDGTFLKGQVKGELLTAIGRDGNNHVFPIAWAVVNVENKDNWRWFLELLVDDIEVQGGRGMVVISDQHKGLLEAVKDIMPHVEHRQCARHVLANFRKNFNALELKNLFWAASRSTVEGDFNAKMQEIKRISHRAYEWLMAKNPHIWCRAFFTEGYACEAVENGTSESFNGMVRDIRKKPLLTMLEEIRIYMMNRFYHMGQEPVSWKTHICPAIIEKMEEFGKEMRWWKVIPSGGDVFETRYAYASFRVDLGRHVCTCRLWGILGVPCVHAQAALNYIHIEPIHYISPWFNKAKYLATYHNNILPVNGSNMWPRTEYIKPLPPLIRRMPGRPKTKRRKHATEDASKYPTVRVQVNRNNRCSNCLQFGHNRSTCKNAPVARDPAPPTTTGRPRLNVEAGEGTSNPSGPPRRVFGCVPRRPSSAAASQHGQAASQEGPAASSHGPSASQQGPGKPPRRVLGCVPRRPSSAAASEQAPSASQQGSAASLVGEVPQGVSATASQEVFSASQQGSRSSQKGKGPSASASQKGKGHVEEGVNASQEGSSARQHGLGMIDQQGSHLRSQPTGVQASGVQAAGKRLQDASVPDHPAGKRLKMMVKRGAKTRGSARRPRWVSHAEAAAAVGASNPNTLGSDSIAAQGSDSIPAGQKGASSGVGDSIPDAAAGDPHRDVDAQVWLMQNSGYTPQDITDAMSNPRNSKEKRTRRGPIMPRPGGPVFTMRKRLPSERQIKMKLKKGSV